MRLFAVSFVVVHKWFHMFNIHCLLNSSISAYLPFRIWTFHFCSPFPFRSVDICDSSLARHLSAECIREKMIFSFYCWTPKRCGEEWGVWGDFISIRKVIVCIIHLVFINVICRCCYLRPENLRIRTAKKQNEMLKRQLQFVQFQSILDNKFNLLHIVHL